MIVYHTTVFRLERCRQDIVAMETKRIHRSSSKQRCRDAHAVVVVVNTFIFRTAFYSFMVYGGGLLSCSSWDWRRSFNQRESVSNGSSSSQFQLVADLFHEKDDVTSSSKTSRVNVRPAKSLPKAPNKEHRKTVGLQVSGGGGGGGSSSSSSAGLVDVTLPAVINSRLCWFSSAALCIFSWRRWTPPRLTTSAASNPTTWRRPSRESLLVFLSTVQMISWETSHSLSRIIQYEWKET